MKRVFRRFASAPKTRNIRFTFDQNDYMNTRSRGRSKSDISELYRKLKKLVERDLVKDLREEYEEHGEVGRISDLTLKLAKYALESKNYQSLEFLLEQDHFDVLKNRNLVFTILSRCKGAEQLRNSVKKSIIKEREFELEKNIIEHDLVHVMLRRLGELATIYFKFRERDYRSVVVKRFAIAVRRLLDGMFVFLVETLNKLIEEPLQFASCFVGSFPANDFRKFRVAVDLFLKTLPKEKRARKKESKGCEVLMTRVSRILLDFATMLEKYIHEEEGVDAKIQKASYALSKLYKKSELDISIDVGQETLKNIDLPLFISSSLRDSEHLIIDLGKSRFIPVLDPTDHIRVNLIITSHHIVVKKEMKKKNEVDIYQLEDHCVDVLQPCKGVITFRIMTDDEMDRASLMCLCYDHKRKEEEEEEEEEESLYREIRNRVMEECPFFHKFKFRHFGRLTDANLDSNVRKIVLDLGLKKYLVNFFRVRRSLEEFSRMDISKVMGYIPNERFAREFMGKVVIEMENKLDEKLMEVMKEKNNKKKKKKKKKRKIRRKRSLSTSKKKVEEEEEEIKSEVDPPKEKNDLEKERNEQSEEEEEEEMEIPNPLPRIGYGIPTHVTEEEEEEVEKMEEDVKIIVIPKPTEEKLNQLRGRWGVALKKKKNEEEVDEEEVEEECQPTTKEEERRKEELLMKKENDENVKNRWGVVLKKTEKESVDD